MNKIKFELSKLNRPEYITDTKRIVKLAFEYGILLSLKEAEDIWQEYNDEMGAGWMNVPKSDNDLWLILTGREDEIYR